jgi:L-amino acid N-acyltransferase YncA
MSEARHARLRHATTADLDACRPIYAPEVLEGTASFELEPPDPASASGRTSPRPRSISQPTSRTSWP